MCVRVVVVVLVFSREGKVSKKLVGSPQVRNPSSTAICKVRKKKGGGRATRILPHCNYNTSSKRRNRKGKKHKFQTKLHLLSSSCNRNQRNIPTRERERERRRGGS